MSFPAWLGTEPLRGALMVCGTTSDAGKSTLVAGLCRLFAREGISVAPFKAQNMSLNSAVTADGHEIGRAQAFQAFAAGIAPEVAMNPVLLKPTGNHSSQVVVNGVAQGVLTAAEYQQNKLDLLPTVLAALADLRARFDVVICEGAGSPAEINLLERDIVNLPLAHGAGIPAIVVGDINLGGVFAALYGTVGVLPPHLRDQVKGFVINKLRGDPTLLADGPARLAELTGVPVLGIVPWLDTTGLAAEDSMFLDRPVAPPRPALADELDVAVVRFPHISNFTDLEPLSIEPGVRLRMVHDHASLGRPDLVIMPGTKATVDDLAWLRRTGLADAIAATEATVVGICGGFQMMGTWIDDSVESGAGRVPGMGLLPVTTTFGVEKVTLLRRGTAEGEVVEGYQIHHGRVSVTAGVPVEPFVVLEPTSTDDPGRKAVLDGVAVGSRTGTTLHGLFDNDRFRHLFLAAVAEHRGKRWLSDGTSFSALRSEAIDRLADALTEHLDLARMVELIASGGEGSPPPGA